MGRIQNYALEYTSLAGRMIVVLEAVFTIYELWPKQGTMNTVHSPEHEDWSCTVHYGSSEKEIQQNQNGEYQQKCLNNITVMNRWSAVYPA